MVSSGKNFIQRSHWWFHLQDLEVYRRNLNIPRKDRKKVSCTLLSIKEIQNSTKRIKPLRGKPKEWEKWWMNKKKCMRNYLQKNYVTKTIWYSWWSVIWWMPLPSKNPYPHRVLSSFPQTSLLLPASCAVPRKIPHHIPL